jgi:hypothetical protein
MDIAVLLQNSGGVHNEDGQEEALFPRGRVEPLRRKHSTWIVVHQKSAISKAAASHFMNQV